jgi:hypothetical protein
MKRQASVGMFYLYTFIICIAIAALTSCASTYQHCDAYGSVDNPNNEEFVNEVAFNNNIDPEEVTQAMFDARY